MKTNAMKIHPDDNVAVALKKIFSGDKIIIESIEFQARTEIPESHKIALIDIKENGKVIKYGHSIGTASCNINMGDWIHTHNIKAEEK